MNKITVIFLLFINLTFTLTADVNLSKIRETGNVLENKTLSDLNWQLDIEPLKDYCYILDFLGEKDAVCKIDFEPEDRLYDSFIKTNGKNIFVETSDVVQKNCSEDILQEILTLSTFVEVQLRLIIRNLQLSPNECPKSIDATVGKDYYLFKEGMVDLRTSKKLNKIVTIALKRLVVLKSITEEDVTTILKTKSKELEFQKDLNSTF